MVPNLNKITAEQEEEEEKVEEVKEVKRDVKGQFRCKIRSLGLFSGVRVVVVET